MDKIKTYRQYIEQTSFNKVWDILRSQYGETEDVKQSYIDLCEELKSLPKSPNGKPIQIREVYDFYRETLSEKLLYLSVDNVCYRQEVLIDQKVKVSTEQKIKDEEMLALILHMSTLHGFETGRQADKAMADWLKSLKDDEPQRIQSDTDRNKAEAKSLERKKHYFWKHTINYDYAYDWSPILIILRRKIEFNIGYWYYHQRYVGWDVDVSRMELCCKLIDIAIDDGISGQKFYLNYRNAHRFKKNELSDDKDIIDSQTCELRAAKACHLVFKLLEKEIHKWWD